ncbi:probable galactinol--sucrose galactosyltransferase 2 [Nymphaea colorata]|nr:probable galactinol--sucrose galactosyltransferase 2 [Nymphaea colorata]
MTITAVPSIRKRILTVRGKPILTNVPENVVVSSPQPPGHAAAFLGATSSVADSRHIFSLGILQGYRWMCLFRFNIWWMIPRYGNCGKDVPLESQMLLIEVREECAIHDEDDDGSGENTFYVLLLPVLDGKFRSSLQGNSQNEIQFCIESGDPDVKTNQSLEAVFVNSGDHPFELMKESIQMLAKHKGTFSHIESKKIPAHLDLFGWCTWDAFYTNVDPRGIKEGLESLSAGGTPARFLIIDDGWQNTLNEYEKDGQEMTDGTQFATRLVDIKENKKFQDFGSDDSCNNLKHFIHKMKETYGLQYVYMWHALIGYWGGILPTSPAMEKYNPRMEFPVQSPGNIGNLRDVAIDSMEKYGVGVIDPEKLYNFFNDLHGYLTSQGVDGVKVDVQNSVETLGKGYGGRVLLMRKYQRALEESVARNFKGNHLICCMSHDSEYIYNSKASAVARASEDFMPNEPTLQTRHIASVAFNSMLLGEIVVPDWDMFHSLHATAHFHAAARALGGCGVYVSDKPGEHDFKILKKLVLSDGSVLRARYPGRPTRDCLFNDPVMDGKSLLKIWNLNKSTGVLGAFNCQGAGSWPCREKVQDEHEPVSQSAKIFGHVSPKNIEYLEELAGESWTGHCAVFAFNSGKLSKLPSSGKIGISLRTLEFEIFTISPIKEFCHHIQFAPLGLTDMYNSGGAIEELSNTNDPFEQVIKITARGCGCFGAYSNMKPKHCLVDAEEVDFDYDTVDGLLTFKLSLGSQKGRSLRHISITY